MHNQPETRKTLTATVSTMALLLSITAGIQSCNLAAANPYVHQNDTPPNDMRPPSLSLQSPKNNRVYSENSLILAFNVSMPTSENYTAIIFSVSYEADWLKEKVYAYQFPEGKPRPTEFDYSQALFKVPGGNHKLVVTVHGDYYRQEGYIIHEFGVLSASATVQFLVCAPPVVSDLSVFNKTYAKSDVPLNFTVAGLVSLTTYSLDGKENVTVNGNTTLTGLSDGFHSVTLFAENVYGVASSETAWFNVDTLPARISFLSPQNATYYTKNIAINFTLDEPVSNLSLSFDGKERTKIAGNITLFGVPYGSHSVIVYATDMVGNFGSSETVYFIVAEPFPTVPVIVVSTTSISVAAACLLLYYRKCHRKAVQK